MSVHKAMWRKMLRKGFPVPSGNEGELYGNNTEASSEGTVKESGMATKEATGIPAASEPAASPKTGNASETRNNEIVHTAKTQEDHKYDQLYSQYGFAENERLALEKIKGIEDSKQVIVVTPLKTSKSWARLRLYEKVDGCFRKVYHDMKAYIGLEGFKPVKNAELTSTERIKYKCEGDNATPAGTFTISSLFGWGENPGFTMPYRQTTKDDYWVSGSRKDEYNVLITSKGGPKRSWVTYERLNIPEYKYAAVIDYNNGPDRIVNNGSAIFLHISGDRDYTNGCVTLSEGNLLKVLKWLKPECKPVIVLGKL